MNQRGKFAAATLLTAILLAATGCNQTPTPTTTKNKPPRVVKVTLSPLEPRPGEPITASVSASDPEGRDYKIEYRWSVNGKEIEAQTGEVLDTASLLPNAKIRADARAVETESGLAGDWMPSAGLTLGAATGPALVGVQIEPQLLRRGQPAVAVIDYGQTDPDSVETVYYKWSVNREVVSEGAGLDRLDIDKYKRGDQVKVVICVDGAFTAPYLWTSKIYIISNTPPTWVSTPTIQGEGTIVTFRIEATDPDGDRLSYRLDNLPPGATSTTVSEGVFSVDTTAVAPGVYQVMAIAEDGEAKIDAGLNLSITRRTVPKKKPAPTEEQTEEQTEEPTEEQTEEPTEQTEEQTGETTQEAE